MSNRGECVCKVFENEDCNRYGLFLGSQQNTIWMSEKDFDEFRHNIKENKKKYKKFILFYYDAEFGLYIFHGHPINTRLESEFLKQYPYASFDVLF